MAGLRPQAARWNFLHELLDLRWMQDCDRTARPYDSEDVPGDLVCDVGQAWHHQCTGPAMTILTASKGFHFKRRRTLAPFELLMQQGWPRAIVNLEHFSDLPPTFPWELVVSSKVVARRKGKVEPQALGDAPPPPTKKARKPRKQPRLRCLQNVLTEMAGNGMCLPDFTRHSFSGFLAVEDPTLFECPCDDTVFAELNSIPRPDVPVAICFDPLVDDPRRIRRVLTTMQGGGPEDIAVQVQGFAD